jgi:hypothetical protein
VIAGVLLLLAGQLALFLGAHELLRRVRTGDAALDLLIFLILRLLLLSGAVLLAGLSGTLTRWGLGTAALTALAALLAGGAQRRVERPSLPRLDAWMLWLAGAVALRYLLQAWFFAPHLGDALAYHLPKIGEWVRAGGFTRELGLHPHATFPAGFELLETWWVVFLRHDVLIEMAGVEFVVLGAAAVFVLGKHVGLKDGAAFLAALLFAVSPGFCLGATSGLNDSAAAAMVAATAALVASRVSWGIVALSVGLGLGIKATYGFALPGLALLAGLSRREPRLGDPARGWSAALGAAGLLAGAFWYARNALWFGNPFYPLGSAGVFNPVAVQFGPSVRSFLGNVTALIDVRVYDPQPLGANVDESAGWGAAAFALGLPGLLWNAGEPRWRRLVTAFGVSLAGSLLFVQNDPWCLKYVFYVPALLAVAAGRLWEALPPLRGIVLAALAASFAGSIVSYDLPRRDLSGLAAQPWRTRAAPLREGGAFRGDTVACVGGHALKSYLAYGPDFSRRVVYLRPAVADELAAAMKREGAELLFADSDPRTSELLQRAIEAGALQPLEGNLYRLRDGSRK